MSRSKKEVAEETEKKVTVVIEWITPKKAAEYLLKNTRNRAIREAGVSVLRKIMEAGKYEVTTSGIGFDINGVLCDGQHRLLAIIRSGVTVRCAVFRNLSLDAQDVTDANMRRTLGQQLGIRGVKEANTMAAATVIIVSFRRARAGRVAVANLTIPEGIEEYEKLTDMRRFLPLCRRLYRATRVPVSFGIAVAHLFSEVSEGDAHEFIQGVEIGDELPSGSPILTLRNMVIKDGAKAPGRPRMSNLHRGVIFVKAWNYWRAGATMRTIPWSGREFPDWTEE